MAAAERPRTRDERQLAETVRAFRRRARAAAARSSCAAVRCAIVFRQVEPHRAAVLFRRGKLDEAPVPLGDIRAALDDETVGDAVRVTRSRAVDALRASRLPASLRDTLAATAARRDYALLVPEDLDAATPSPPARVVPRGPRRRSRPAADAGADRRRGRPDARYGASLLAASWRDLGLDVHVVRRGRERDLRARVPPPRTIPIARAVDARFVSPRVRGWRENARGVVDYARVKLRLDARASSRLPVTLKCAVAIAGTSAPNG